MLPNDVYRKFTPFKRAIKEGDADFVKEFISSNPNAKNDKIDLLGQTALHLAIDAGQIRIVKDLLQIISDEDGLRIEDNIGNTPLCLAAQIGNTEAAKSIVKNSMDPTSLLGIMNRRGDIPVCVASMAQNKDTARYLYSVTPKELFEPENENGHGSVLLVSCIAIHMFDIALDLIENFPALAIVRNRYGSTPLAALIRTPSLFPSFFMRESRLDIIAEGENVEDAMKPKGWLDRFSRWGANFLESILLIDVSCIQKLYHLKHDHLCAKKILECMAPEIVGLDLGYLESFGLLDLFFEAVENGRVEIVVAMVKANPSLLYARDRNSRGMFMLAVQFRQEKIFSLIYGIKTRKDLLIDYKDKFQSNMLHIAGMSPPISMNDRIPNPAMRMERELEWYKEVENVMNVMEWSSYNLDYATPREVFNTNHKDLANEAGNWVKSNASSCAFVCALIISISFAAAITFPGSNDQENGYPLLLKESSFKIFMVSNAISLLSSSTSVLIFLRLMTISFVERDFLETLPKMIMIALTTLFISIQAMIVAFCAAFFAVLKGELGFFIPIVVLASYNINALALAFSPILKKISVSSCGLSGFDKTNKDLAHVIM
ncbi:uncharacterized protein [Rutidosis leptorrhynchoides]|uniref:uncharacterized protein n=1 Tax=Rutidosis leptorrhynchoides TaxID=125765 RepID=UPI003A9902E9